MAEVGKSSRKRASSPARGSKPGERRGGRKKGTPNKLTQTFKQAIETAFENVGGAEYLEKMAVLQPVAFMGWIGKVLPTQIEHSNPDGSMKQPTTIQIVAAKVADGDRED